MLAMFQEMQAAFPWFFTGVFFVLGAIVGSFLNVCIFRIPRGESLAFPSSHCACGVPIPAWLNVPVVSWLFLRGRAVCCGRKISVRYPAVELLTAVLFATAWHFLPWDTAIPAMIFCAFGIVLSFIDWDTMFLPDSVNGAFIIVGLFCGAAFPHALGEAFALDGFFAAGTGLVVGSALIFWFRFFASLILKKEAMGEGDVILLGGIGAFLGWRGAVFAFFFSSFFGLAAYFLVRIFSRKCTEENLEATEASQLSLEGDDEAAAQFADTESTAFPLGPWLILSGAAYFIFGEKIISLIANAYSL